METTPVKFSIEPKDGKIITCYYFFSDYSPLPNDTERMEKLGLIDFYIRFEGLENYSGFQQRVTRDMMNVHNDELLSIATREALGFFDPEKYPFPPHKYWPSKIQM